MGEPVIEFKNVNFAYSIAAYVKDINITIEKGDFISLIGSNGAGKSTFSKLCNGLLKPESGDVLVLGKNTKKEKVSNLAKHLGFLFQNPDRQICCDTVKKELMFSLKNNGVPAQEIEIVKNLKDNVNSPWYVVNPSELNIYTPQWTFTIHELKRFK